MKKVFLLIMMMIMVISCKEEEIISNPDLEKTNSLDTQSKRERKVGMLQFKTAKSLESFIKEKLESKTSLLDEAEALSKKGVYNSLLLVSNLERNEAEELGINEREIPIVKTDDDMLLYLLNQNGEIEIEDKIFRIDGDFVYTYSKGASEDIDTFLQKYKSGSVKMKRNTTLEFSKNLSIYMHNNVKEKSQEKLLARQTKYNYFDKNHRMKSRQYDGYWWFYSSIGAKTIVQKRKKFLWFSWWKNIKAFNRLKTDVTYRVRYVNNPYYYFYRSNSGFYNCNCKSLKKTFGFSVGFPRAPYVFTPIEGKTTHWAHWYGGGSGSTDTVSRDLYY